MSIPLSTILITTTFPTAVLADVVTHWTDMRTPIGSIAAPIASGDTSFSLGQQTALAVGQTIVIDSEPMVISSVSGQTYTVVRGIAATVPPLAHDASAPVAVLTHPNLFDMLNEECFKGYVMGIVNSLAMAGRSASFVPPTGSISAQ